MIDEQHRRRFTPEELATCPCPDPFRLYIGFNADCPLHGTKTEDKDDLKDVES